jgi:hypothetical protein
VLVHVLIVLMCVVARICLLMSVYHCSCIAVVYVDASVVYVVAVDVEVGLDGVCAGRADSCCWYMHGCEGGGPSNTRSADHRMAVATDSYMMNSAHALECSPHVYPAHELQST